MSISASHSPSFNNNFDTPIYSQVQSNMTGRQSPIKKYMRENNCYLFMQQEAARKGHSNLSTQQELTNLKQFQRLLEQDTTFKHEQITPIQVFTSNHQVKQRVTYSPNIIQKSSQKPKQKNQSAYQHRTHQTNTYGNKVIDKIKSFILNEKHIVSPKSPSPKKTLPSFNVSSSIQKLHKSAQKTQAIRRQQYVNKFFGEELKQVKPFKVQNPISLYLIQKRNDEEGGYIPLYQRAVDLARQKSMSRMERQLEKEHEQQLQQQQQILKFEEIRKQKYSDSMNKEKQDKLYHDLMMKQKIKNFQKQQQKINRLKDITKQKPYVSKMSKNLFNKIIEKNELSKDFVQRNQEYKLQRQKQKLKITQKYDEQYCPFTPQISDSSREIAKKYHQRKKQEEQKFKQKADSERELIRKINQLSAKINKSKSPSLQKSLSFNKSSFALKNKQKKLWKGNQNQENKFQNTKQKQKQIPIYNRYNPDKKRTNSCFNIGCRK